MLTLPQLVCTSLWTMDDPEASRKGKGNALKETMVLEILKNFIDLTKLS